MDSRVSFVHGDIHDHALLLNAMHGSNTIFHFATPDISKAESDPVLDFREKTFLTQNVLEAARNSGVKRIVFTSGSGVYGEVPSQIFSESYVPCLRINPYSVAKLGTDALISTYCNMFKIRDCAFRFANVVGPNQTHGVGYDFLKRLMGDGTRLQILSDGTQCKSYIYIPDVLDAVELIMLRMELISYFDVFNVAATDQITVKDIAELACNTIGLELNNVEFIYSGGERGWNSYVPKILSNADKISGSG